MEIKTQENDKENQKIDFCEYAPKCTGSDKDCFYPYKTSGCHGYKTKKRFQEIMINIYNKQTPTIQKQLREFLPNLVNPTKEEVLRPD